MQTLMLLFTGSFQLPSSKHAAEADKGEGNPHKFGFSQNFLKEFVAPKITLQYSDNSQNSLSSHGLDEEGSRSVCLSDHILRSEQSIYRLV